MRLAVAPLVRAPISLLLAGVAASGGGELALPNQGQPSEIVVVWGNGQSGTIGELLGDSLVVRVVDRFGDPVGGSEVTWTAEVGGSVTPPTSVTSPDGQAGTQRVLGADVGTYLTTAPFGVASGELGRGRTHPPRAMSRWGRHLSP